MSGFKLFSLALVALGVCCSKTYAHDHEDGGNVPQVSICSVRSEALEPQLFTDLGSQRIKVRYGPFTVPPRSVHHGMQNFKCAPPSPCGDCLITWMQAGLEYVDGSLADAESGMWLHHTAWQNLEQKDKMCKSKHGNRFFASGNERTPIDLTSSGLNKFGYKLSSRDGIAFSFEAMNMQEKARDIVLTMTWEYIPSRPNDFQEVQPFWFDVGGCGHSNMPAKPDSVFSYSSSPVKAPWSGTIAMAVSHLHDGGTKLEIFKNGKPLCIAEPTYENSHIKGMTTCDNLPFSKGEQLSIVAHYDTNKHALMAHPDGKLEPVMGISLIYAVGKGSSKGGHHKHIKKHIAIGVLSAALLITTFIIGWFKYRGREARSKIRVPKWLQGYLQTKRDTSNGAYQILVEAEDGAGYRD